MKLFVNRGRRSGIGEDELRWALTEGAVIPDDGDRLDQGAGPVLVRRALRRQAKLALERLDGHQARGQADPGRVREGLMPGRQVSGFGIARLAPPRGPRGSGPEVPGAEDDTQGDEGDRDGPAVTATCWPTE